MANKELATFSISELAPLIKKHEISPVDVVKSVISRIEAQDETINSYITVLKDEAIRQAVKAEEEILQGNYKGPLHGIPIAIKDNYDTHHIKTTYGSCIYKENIPDRNATVVDRLIEDGAILLGKLNLHEFAIGSTTDNPHFGPTRNPLEINKIPGGSSGGSSAALAAHMTIGSLGTDTAGSIRIPSACCGTVGLKPTYGRVSKFGVFPLAWSLDHVGPMTKTVEDAAIMLNAIAGYDKNDSTTVQKPVPNYLELLNEKRDLKGMVVAVPNHITTDVMDESVKKNFDHVMEVFSDLGAEMIDFEIPSIEHVNFSILVTLYVEASAVHHENLKKMPENFGDDIRPLLQFGELISGVQYMKAQQIRQKLKNELSDLYKKADAMICPTIPFPALDIGKFLIEIQGKKMNALNEMIRYTSLANLVGLPALSLPSGLSEDGMPTGFQIIGHHFDEGKILNIGHLFESVNM